MMPQTVVVLQVVQQQFWLLLVAVVVVEICIPFQCVLADHTCDILYPASTSICPVDDWIFCSKNTMEMLCCCYCNFCFFVASCSMILQKKHLPQNLFVSWVFFVLEPAVHSVALPKWCLIHPLNFLLMIL